MSPRARAVIRRSPYSPPRNTPSASDATRPTMQGNPKPARPVISSASRTRRHTETRVSVAILRTPSQPDRMPCRARPATTSHTMRRPSASTAIVPTTASRWSPQPCARSVMHRRSPPRPRPVTRRARRVMQPPRTNRRARFPRARPATRPRRSASTRATTTARHATATRPTSRLRHGRRARPATAHRQRLPRAVTRLVKTATTRTAALAARPRPARTATPSRRSQDTDRVSTARAVIAPTARMAWPSRPPVRRAIRRRSDRVCIA